MIWISKHEPVYIFDGDYWLNEITKDVYIMNVSKNAYISLWTAGEDIGFTKKMKILKVK